MGVILKPFWIAAKARCFKILNFLCRFSEGKTAQKNLKKILRDQETMQFLKMQELKTGSQAH